MRPHGCSSRAVVWRRRAPVAGRQRGVDTTRAALLARYSRHGAASARSLVAAARSRYVCYATRKQRAQRAASARLPGSRFQAARVLCSLSLRSLACFWPARRHPRCCCRPFPSLCHVLFVYSDSGTSFVRVFSRVRAPRQMKAKAALVPFRPGCEQSRTGLMRELRENSEDSEDSETWRVALLFLCPPPTRGGSCRGGRRALCRASVYVTNVLLSR